MELANEANQTLRAGLIRAPLSARRRVSDITCLALIGIARPAYALSSSLYMSHQSYNRAAEKGNIFWLRALEDDVDSVCLFWR
jgi:hypothetical protein